ncbi:unnamed protein product [Cylicocyclus nassatus]|uniref:Uncharacterized protein n=1 Tax=Cylicocyclus nassatus TaxID=53992 RepID=A0AA36MAB3_CYLNA|nr:unnamed protein product [Cylicocyclus nassatus]
MHFAQQTLIFFLLASLFLWAFTFCLVTLRTVPNFGKTEKESHRQWSEFLRD